MDVHPLFAGSLGVIPAGTHQDAHIVILYLRNYCGPTRIANYCTSVKTVLFHSLIPKINREWHNLEQIQIWLRTAASYSGDPSDNKAHQKTFNLDNLGILMLQWLQYQSPTTHTDTTHIYICTFILAVVYTTTPCWGTCFLPWHLAAPYLSVHLGPCWALEMNGSKPRGLGLILGLILGCFFLGKIN